MTDRYYKTDITDASQFQVMWDSTGTFSMRTAESKFNIGDAILLEEVWDGYRTGRIIFASIEDRAYNDDIQQYILDMLSIAKQDEDIKGEA